MSATWEGLKRLRRRTPPDGVVAERRGAVLTRRNGRMYCTCPFACLAACEPCEFAGVYDQNGKRL